MIVADAHVHVGYFPRKDGKGGEAFYYSPRKMLGILNRVGVDQFIFSSTNAVWDEHAEAMHREAKEFLRISNGRAHAFFWVSNKYFDWDPCLNKAFSAVQYEGIKLHPRETPWLTRTKDFDRILSIARERRLPVTIHTDEDNPAASYLPYCQRYPSVRFNLAHGRDQASALAAMRSAENVYVDCSFVPPLAIAEFLQDNAAQTRLMYGSDLPAPRRSQNISLTAYARKRISLVKNLAGNCADLVMWQNMRRFLEVAPSPYSDKAT